MATKGARLVTDGTQNSVTIIFPNEGHTLGNVLRWSLIKHREVTFAGYTLPHPLIAEMNIRIITKSAPALDVAVECTRNLTAMCEHMLRVFEDATTM